MKNPRVSVSVLLALLFSLFAVCGVSEEITVSSREELIDLFKSCRAQEITELEISCSEDFYADISKDRFAEATLIEWEAGVTNAYLRYSESYRLLKFSSLEFGEVHFARVSTLGEAREAIAGFAADGVTAFNLACADGDLFSELFQGRQTYVLSALNGIGDLYMSGGGNIVYVTDVEYFQDPFAVVGSEAEFLDAVAAFADQETDAFHIVFEPEFYEALNANPEMSRKMNALSRLSDCWRRTNGTAHYTEYSNATFSNTPKAVCDTENDIVEAIRAFGLSGESEFELILNEELYNAVHEGYFERLEALETEAGLTSRSLSYSFSDYILYYSEAVIVTDAKPISTIGEAIEYVNECVMNGMDEISLFCSEELYGKLLEGWSNYSITSNSMVPIMDLLSHAGISNCSFTRSGSTGVIVVSIESLYPGVRILRAVENNDFSALTERETQTYEAASALAASLKADTDLKTAENIHDALCEMIVYTSDDHASEDDNAIGAILNGQANCDGYSDAFYLIGQLAGLNVRCQHGDSYDKGFLNAFGSETHMWNVVEIDGTWRLIDVTWDDTDEGFRKTWFNIGYDRASLAYKWNEEMTVPLDPVTDLSMRPENEYLAETADDVITAVNDATAKRFHEFFIFYTNAELAEDYHSAVQTVGRTENVQDFLYSWNQHMQMLGILNVLYR